jgi:hypothetical protein
VTEAKAENHRTKYVELPVEGFRTRVRFPPPPPEHDSKKSEEGHNS